MLFVTNARLSSGTECSCVEAGRPTGNPRPDQTTPGLSCLSRSRQSGIAKQMRPGHNNAMFSSGYQEIKDGLRQQYIADPRPWLLGFSGGKDSTMLASL